MQCRCPPVDDKGYKEEESEKDKENCDPSGSSIPSTVSRAMAQQHSCLNDSAPGSTLQPKLLPASNTGSIAVKPPTDRYPMCKSARAKPVLSKESPKGVFRPQPFRRFPTTKNVERVTMRNNLRDMCVAHFLVASQMGCSLLTTTTMHAPQIRRQEGTADERPVRARRAPTSAPPRDLRVERGAPRAAQPARHETEVPLSSHP